MKTFFITVGAMALLVAAIMFAAPAKGEESCEGVGKPWVEYFAMAVDNGFDVVQYSDDKAKGFVQALETVIGPAPDDLVREQVMVIDTRAGFVIVELGSKDCAQYTLRMPNPMFADVINRIRQENP